MGSLSKIVLTETNRSFTVLPPHLLAALASFMLLRMANSDRLVFGLLLGLICVQAYT